VGNWKQLKSATELTVGCRIRIKHRVYEVVSLSAQAITLKRQETGEMNLEYKVSLLIQKTEIWSDED